MKINNKLIINSLLISIFFLSFFAFFNKNKDDNNHYQSTFGVLALTCYNDFCDCSQTSCAIQCGNGIIEHEFDLFIENDDILSCLDYTGIHCNETCDNGRFNGYIYDGVCCPANHSCQTINDDRYFIRPTTCIDESNCDDGFSWTIDICNENSLCQYIPNATFIENESNDNTPEDEECPLVLCYDLYHTEHDDDDNDQNECQYKPRLDAPDVRTYACREEDACFHSFTCDNGTLVGTTTNFDVYNRLSFATPGPRPFSSILRVPCGRQGQVAIDDIFYVDQENYSPLFGKPNYNVEYGFPYYNNPVPYQEENTNCGFQLINDGSFIYWKATPFGGDPTFLPEYDAHASAVCAVRQSFVDECGNNITSEVIFVISCCGDYILDTQTGEQCDTNAPPDQAYDGCCNCKQNTAYIQPCEYDTDCNDYPIVPNANNTDSFYFPEWTFNNDTAFIATCHCNYCRYEPKPLTVFQPDLILPGGCPDYPCWEGVAVFDEQIEQMVCVYEYTDNLEQFCTEDTETCAYNLQCFEGTIQATRPYFEISYYNQEDGLGTFYCDDDEIYIFEHTDIVWYNVDNGIPFYWYEVTPLDPNDCPLIPEYSNGPYAYLWFSGPWDPTTNERNPDNICHFRITIHSNCGETHSFDTFARVSCCGDNVLQIDRGEDCDFGYRYNGNTTSCCSSSCQVKSSSNICRESIGPCDLDEYCDGTSPVCPPDKRDHSFTPCRSSDNYGCIANAMCDGVSADCPDSFTPANTPCNSDDNLCTIEMCNGEGDCLPGFMAYNDPDDGNVCNGFELCDPETGLAYVIPTNCNDLNSCTIDYCDVELNDCVNYDYPIIGTQCGVTDEGVCEFGQIYCDNDDQDMPFFYCSGNIDPSPENCNVLGYDENCNGLVDEGCYPQGCLNNGDCVGYPHDSQCQTTFCNEFNLCQVADQLVNTPCINGQVCMVDDICNGMGTCVDGPTERCDDHNLDLGCGDFECNPFNGECTMSCYPRGYICSPYTIINGSVVYSNDCDTKLCGDYNCQCSIDNPLPCPKSFNPCAEYVCNGDGPEHCVLVPVNGRCDDGNLCTEYDQCINMTCVGTPIICDDHIPCTNDYCDTNFGTCHFELDCVSCYIDGICYDVGQYNPSDPCYKCDPSQSAIEWSFVPNAPCFDGDYCTVDDTCNLQTHQCTGTPVDCSDLNSQCTLGVCNPFSGECEIENVREGANCDDDKYCTIGETCQQGECVSQKVRDCSEYDGPCYYYECDLEANECIYHQQPDFITQCHDDYSYCDDEDHGPCPNIHGACYEPSTCIFGSCYWGRPIDCGESTQCMIHSCDGELGCIRTLLSGEPCTDNNVCTIGDYCGEGDYCVPGAELLDCNDNDPCTIDTCDAIQGCSHELITDCYKCRRLHHGHHHGHHHDDDDPFHHFGDDDDHDHFVFDECTPKPCNLVQCNHITGLCEYTPQPFGTPCGNNNVCDGEEFCDGAGTCVVTETSLNCDDGNRCTDDSCHPQLGCQSVPNNAEDGPLSNPCEWDSCVNGTLVRQHYDCSVYNTPCQTFYCGFNQFYDFPDPICLPSPVRVNLPCDDEDMCTSNDICNDAGQCVGTPTICPEPNECQVFNTCDTLTGECTLSFVDEGVPCNRGNLCVDSVCDGLGNCTEIGPAVDCNVTNSIDDQCHAVGECVPATGECSFPILENGTPCIDQSGDLCVLSSECFNGRCTPSEYVRCEYELDQFNECTYFPTCDSQTGNCTIQYKPLGSFCDDGNLCSVSSSCDGFGHCDGTDYLDCSLDTDIYHPQCASSYCLEFSGECFTYYFEPYTPCQPDNLCIAEGYCMAGRCEYSSNYIDCSIDRNCTADYCFPEIGCYNADMDSECAYCEFDEDCPYIPCKYAWCDAGMCNYNADDSTYAARGCSNGNFCDGTQLCHNGVCISTEPPSCDDHNECTVDFCSNGAGRCQHEPKALGTACTFDDDLCYEEAYCDPFGQCLPFSPYIEPCDEAPPCYVSVGCDDETGLCKYIPMEDGTGCDDGNACTDNDMCWQGHCFGDPIVLPQIESAFIFGECIIPPVCNPLTGEWAIRFEPIGMPCNDGKFCTGNDHCDGRGNCVGVSDNICSLYLEEFDSQCKELVCSEEERACIVRHFDDGTECSTGVARDVCSGRDVCSNGECVRKYAGYETICRPDDCTGCDVAEHCSGCSDACPFDAKVLDGTECPDDFFCMDSHCLGGKCKLDTPVVCPSSECMTGYCNEATKECLLDPKPRGALCSANPEENDEFEENEFPTCINFKACDGQGTCILHYAPVSKPCDDQNPCTINDHCSGQGNECVPGVEKDCSEFDTFFTVGTCLISTGECIAHNIRDDDECGHGKWSYRSRSCECEYGWDGQFCRQCAIPPEEDHVFLCVPSRIISAPYILRSIHISELDEYLNNEYPFIDIPNLPTVYPNTHGLDCACNSNFHHSDDDDNDFVRCLQLDNALSICEETWNSTLTNFTGVEGVDDVYEDLVNDDADHHHPHRHHDDDDEEHHQHHHHNHTLEIVLAIILALVVFVVLGGFIYYIYNYYYNRSSTPSSSSSSSLRIQSKVNDSFSYSKLSPSSSSTSSSLLPSSSPPSLHPQQPIRSNIAQTPFSSKQATTELSFSPLGNNNNGFDSKKQS